MTIALVQEADSASSSVTLGSSATAGNTVVVAVACLGPTAATGVTGITLGGSPDNFTLIAPGPSGHDTTSPNDWLNVSVWADANCAAGTAISVTGTGVVATWAFEFSGVAGTADIAQVFAVSAYQDSWLATTGQAHLPAEAWFAVIAAANQTGTPSPAVISGSGWTLETAHSGTSGSYDWGAVAGYQTVNTVGTPSFSGSFSQPSFSVTVIVTLGAGTPAVPAAVSAPLAGNVTVHGDFAAHGALDAGGVISQAGAPVGLTPTGVITGNYTAKPGDFVIANASGTNVITITFPAGAPDRSLVGVKLAEAGPATLAVQASGTDVFDLQPPGTTQIDLTTTGQTFIAQYKAVAGTWYTQSAGYQFPGAPPVNTPMPYDLGLVTWSYDPAYLSGSFSGVALSSGVITLIQCPVRATTQCSGVIGYVTSAGSGLTSGQNFAGAYSSTGALIGTTADLTATWGSTGRFAITFNPSVPETASPPFAWAAFLSNGSTPPSLAITGNKTAVWANMLLPTNVPRFGTLSGTYTSLPSSFGAATPTTTAAEYWSALF